MEEGVGWGIFYGLSSPIEMHCSNEIERNWIVVWFSHNLTLWPIRCDAMRCLALPPMPHLGT